MTSGHSEVGQIFGSNSMFPDVVSINTESNLSTAVADTSGADHPKDSKKTNGIVLNGIPHNYFAVPAMAHSQCSRTIQ